MVHEKKDPLSHSRTLMLLRILERFSDEQNPLSTTELLQLLKTQYGITVHRSTLYRDFETLEQCGFDLIKISSTQNHYFLGKRLFEAAELKLLIDAIDSSKCLTESKSQELIDKLLTLTSESQAAALRARPLCGTVAKPKNERIYYIIDTINHAIETGRQITFTYTEYTPEKELVLRGDGEVYTLSPYACMWSGDYYYVIGWSEKHENVIAFRVDRIATTPQITFDANVPPPADFDLCEYSRSIFHMYSGEIETVELACDNDLMKTVIDRFGDGVESAVLDKEHFKITVEVALSPTFYGWLFEFGGKIRLLSPQRACDEYKAMITKATESM